MKIIAFLMLVVGLCLDLWPLAVIGFILYEATGSVWAAAVTSVDVHNDHGP